ncbi:MAG TPA: thymidylate kinase [Candidatus Saccharimonadales bacterium]|nr:thymidylate kinase [Candidatus Saccharimonadales bacterium]
MQQRPGTFIVIEGTDGSGKGTQFELLCERLRQAGYEVATFDFPQYGNPSSYFVKQYLNGEYGGVSAVAPYTASLFYALDRYEAAPKIKQALDAGKIVISNRFTGSSMGHQGTKFRTPEERRGYFIWLDNLEFEMLKIPRPDISFVLRVPADVAEDLIDKKGDREYTSKKRDIHEASRSHLEQSVEVYDDLTQLFPRDFQRIDCVRGGKMLDVNTIQNMLWEKITPLLPPPAQLELASKDIPSAAAAAVQSSPSISQPAEPEKKGGKPAKDEPKKGKTGAAAHTASDFREVTAQHFVLRGASNLLIQHIQSAQLAYAGEITMSPDYTQKDAAGNWRYYTPASLSELTAQHYHAYIGHLFELYTTIVDRVEKHLVQQDTALAAARGKDWLAGMHAQALEAARPVLPAAAANDSIVLAFGQSLENVVTSLLSSDLPELQAAGTMLFKEARVLSPSFLPEVNAGNSAIDPIAYKVANKTAIETLAQTFLPEVHAAETSPVHLTEVIPRNELDILADAIYPHSSLPMRELRNQMAAWPYNRKLDLFEAYVGTRAHRRQQPGRAFEKAQYTWDMVTSYALFRNLQRQQLIGGQMHRPSRRATATRCRQLLKQPVLPMNTNSVLI